MRDDSAHRPAQQHNVTRLRVKSIFHDLERERKKQFRSRLYTERVAAATTTRPFISYLFSIFFGLVAKKLGKSAVRGGSDKILLSGICRSWPGVRWAALLRCYLDAPQSIRHHFSCGGFRAQSAKRCLGSIRHRAHADVYGRTRRLIRPPPTNTTAQATNQVCLLNDRFSFSFYFSSWNWPPAASAIDPCPD